MVNITTITGGAPLGLYDAVDRGGAGRKKEKTLRKPLLIAAAIIAAVIALAVWACR